MQKSVLKRMEEDDEEDIFFIMEMNKKADCDDSKESKTYYGKGNAKSGTKAKYLLYPPSTIFTRVM